MFLQVTERELSQVREAIADLALENEVQVAKPFLGLVLLRLHSEATAQRLRVELVNRKLQA